MAAEKRELAERHDRVKELFFAACDLQPEERSRFLDESCAEEEALRQEVESLLRYHACSQARRS